VKYFLALTILCSMCSSGFAATIGTVDVWAHWYSLDGTEAPTATSCNSVLAVFNDRMRSYGFVGSLESQEPIETKSISSPDDKVTISYSCRIRVNDI
jgi:hypothetical protein